MRVFKGNMAEASVFLSALDGLIREFIEHVRIIKMMAINSQKSYEADLYIFKACCVEFFNEQVLDRLKAAGDPMDDSAADNKSGALSKHNIDMTMKPIDLEKLLRTLIPYCLERRGTKVKLSSLARMTSALRHFVDFLHEEGHITASLLDCLKRPRVTHTPRTIVSVQDVEHFFASLYGDLEHATLKKWRLILWFELLYGLGLRVSELISIEIQHVVQNQERATLYVKGKGSQERLLPLSIHFSRLLEEYLEKASSYAAFYRQPFLFPVSLRSGKQGHVARQVVAREIKDFLISHNCVIVSPHHLRHAFASHLLEGGASLLAVQKLLGHKHIQTTEIYTHVSRQALCRAVYEHHPLSKKR